MDGFHDQNNSLNLFSNGFFAKFCPTLNEAASVEDDSIVLIRLYQQWN
jgi:hypothetical protein